MRRGNFCGRERELDSKFTGMGVALGTGIITPFCALSDNVFKISEFHACD